MTAYMFVQGTISDEDRYGRYREAVMPLIERFEGRHVKGGKVELLEGRQDGRHTALFEFPSLDAIHGFWNSPEYGPVKELRRGAAEMEVWAIPGI